VCLVVLIPMSHILPYPPPNPRAFIPALPGEVFCPLFYKYDIRPRQCCPVPLMEKPDGKTTGKYPDGPPVSVHRYHMNPFLIFVGIILFLAAFPVQLGLFGINGNTAKYAVYGSMAVLLLIIIYGASERIELYDEGIGIKTFLGKEFASWKNVNRIRVSYSVLETLISIPAFRTEYDIYIDTPEGPSMIDLSSDINDATLLMREIKRRAKHADIRFRKKLDLIFLHYDPEKYWRSI